MSVGMVIAMFYLSQGSFLSYCFFSFFMGLFLGAPANIMASHDIQVFAKQSDKAKDYLSNFNVGIGSLSIGLVQLIIGF